MVKCSAILIEYQPEMDRQSDGWTEGHSIYSTSTALQTTHVQTYQHYVQNGFYASDQRSTSYDFLLVSHLLLPRLHLNI